jgi:hypothetical protein
MARFSKKIDEAILVSGGEDVQILRTPTFGKCAPNECSFAKYTPSECSFFDFRFEKPKNDAENFWNKVKIDNKNLEKEVNYTRNEWRRCETTLENECIFRYLLFKLN